MRFGFRSVGCRPATSTTRAPSVGDLFDPNGILLGPPSILRVPCGSSPFLAAGLLFCCLLRVVRVSVPERCVTGPSAPLDDASSGPSHYPVSFDSKRIGALLPAACSSRIVNGRPMVVSGHKTLAAPGVGRGFISQPTPQGRPGMSGAVNQRSSSRDPRKTWSTSPSRGGLKKLPHSLM
jgi:hypothetical protein